MRTIGIALSTVLILVALAACTVSSEDADDESVAEDATETPVMDSQRTDDADDDADAVTDDAVDDSATDDSARDDDGEDGTDDAADDTARDDDADDAVDDAADDATDDDEVSEPQEHVIEILDGNEFSPDEITIAPGDTVTWVNLTDQVHTSSADPEIANDPDNVELPDGAESWHSGNIEPEGEYSVTLEVPGVYVYFCYPHQDAGMIGRIIVEDPDDEAEQDDAEQDDATAVDDEADDAPAADDGTTDVEVDDTDDEALDDTADDATDPEHTGVGGDREYSGKDSVK
jgi:plastocyanin